MHLPRSRRAVVVLTIALTGIAATAFAFWTSSGTGTGSASAGDSAAVTVAQVGTVSDLRPGGDAQPIDFKITNPQDTNQYIADVAVSIDSVVKAAGAPAGTCDATDFAVVQPDAIDQDLVPGDTTFSPSGATLRLVNKTVNQDACKGATVNLAFAAS